MRDKLVLLAVTLGEWEGEERFPEIGKSFKAETIHQTYFLELDDTNIKFPKYRLKMIQPSIFLLDFVKY